MKNEQMRILEGVLISSLMAFENGLRDTRRTRTMLESVVDSKKSLVIVNRMQEVGWAQHELRKMGKQHPTVMAFNSFERLSERTMGKSFDNVYFEHCVINEIMRQAIHGATDRVNHLTTYLTRSEESKVPEFKDDGGAFGIGSSSGDGVDAVDCREGAKGKDGVDGFVAGVDGGAAGVDKYLKE